MVNFPDDIMLDILVRLPVKSIGRFRCVNKVWCKLLKDPKFVQMHLKQAIEMNRFRLMLHNCYRTGLRFNINTIGYPSLSSTPLNIEYPLKYETEGIHCLGYCNGLVCFVGVLMGAALVCIWNPSTREYKELPVSPLETPYRLRYFEYGFGYDYKIEDFKVMSLVRCDSLQGYGSEVQVYTLGSDSWRVIGKIPYDLSGDLIPDMARVPVNGAIHWIARTDDVVKNGALRVIISFDFERETIQEIALPNCADEIGEPGLCVLGGSLCLLGNNVEVWELWELKNYETERSWTKLFTIHPEQIFGFDADLMPLQKSEDGNILLALNKKYRPGFHLILYDPKQETFTIKFYEEVDCHHLCTSIYVESLVSLNSGTYVSAAITETSYQSVDGYKSKT